MPPRRCIMHCIDTTDICNIPKFITAKDVCAGRYSAMLQHGLLPLPSRSLLGNWLTRWRLGIFYPYRIHKSQATPLLRHCAVRLDSHLPLTFIFLIAMRPDRNRPDLNSTWLDDLMVKLTSLAFDFIHSGWVFLRVKLTIRFQCGYSHRRSTTLQRSKMCKNQICTYVCPNTIRDTRDAQESGHFQSQRSEC